MSIHCVMIIYNKPAIRNQLHTHCIHFSTKPAFPRFQTPSPPQNDKAKYTNRTILNLSSSQSTTSNCSHVLRCDLLHSTIIPLIVPACLLQTPNNNAISVRVQRYNIKPTHRAEDSTHREYITTHNVNLLMKISPSYLQWHYYQLICTAGSRCD